MSDRDPVHPGELLRENVLPGLGMNKTTAALKISPQTLYDILNRKQPVTAGMAERFGELFGNGDPAPAERTVDVSGIPTLKPGRLRGTGARRAGRP